MHTLQKLLIRRLVEENGRTYSSLAEGYSAEDNIVFHIKQLMTGGLIEKKDDRYFITAKGINSLSQFQKTDLKDDVFKMFFAGFVCKCDDEYLLKPHRNAKEVFYNLPSGSPLFGEDLAEALPRLFYDETDLHLPYGRFTFDSLHMKTVKSKEGLVLFDDAFGVYSLEVADDEKVKMVQKRGCEWFSLESIRGLSGIWPEIKQCILKTDWKVYKKYDITCDYVLQ